MNNLNKIFIFIYCIIFCFSCTLFSVSDSKKESTIPKCAVLPNQSKLFKGNSFFTVPGGQDVDEASFIYDLLKENINDESLKIAKSPRSGYTEINVWDVVDEKEQEKIACCLRGIYEENEINSIYIVYYGWGEGVNKRTGEVEPQRKIIRELVVE